METIYGQSEYTEVPPDAIPVLIAAGAILACDAHDDGIRYETVWDWDEDPLGSDARAWDVIERVMAERRA